MQGGPEDNSVPQCAQYWTPCCMFTLLSFLIDLIVGLGTPQLGQVKASVETFF